MSRAVQSQADVGNLSLAGLSAFSSILATLSADNVVPMALIQMERLGATLPTNGEYADKARNLLQRCSNVRLDHLAIVIGWRKNDSASLMAESAGGQAIALVSMCLMNLYSRDHAGKILSRLCSRLLPGSMNVSSMSQLADVANLLSVKLNTLGFGNLLAREVTKIHQVYEALSKPAPQDLLKRVDPESAIELLESVSRALREDHKICRISGSRGMGHIVGLLQALFRRDTVVTVEGTIIQDIEHSNIVCEIIQRGYCEPIQIHLETCIPTSKPIELPIAIVRSTFCQFGNMPYFMGRGPYEYNWTGCVADQLQLIFLHYGFTCDQAILDACRDLLVLVPSALRVAPTFTGGYESRNAENLQPALLLTLLGPLPRARICKICEEILRSKPTTSQIDLSTAFSNLVALVAGKVRGISCVCPAEVKCDWMNGWTSEVDSGGYRTNDEMTRQQSRCVLYQLWKSIGVALNLLLGCFFINASPNTTIQLFQEFPVSRHSTIERVVTGEVQTVQISYIRDLITSFTGHAIFNNERMIASSSDSCTSYPTVLQTLRMPSHQSVTFTLIEGLFVFEGRYYDRLEVDSVPARPRTRSVQQQDDIRPSLDAMHIGSPTLTIRDAFKCLEVLCSFKYSGHDTKIDLPAVIWGYVGMRWTDPCHHPMTDPRDFDKDRFQLTSVASPAAEERFGVVMARWNPMAQFLCCEDGYQAILVKDCCLNCAAEGIDPADGVVFIVA